MSNIFRKKFHLSFFNLKYCLTICQSPSFSSDQLNNTNPSSIVRKNFNSVYDLTTSDSTSKSFNFTTSFSTDDDCFSSSEDYSDPEFSLDFTSLFSSGRFFFTSPGTSKSIIDQSSSSSDSISKPDSDSETSLVINNVVKIPKYSLNPYMDFRRSMQEMIEARGVIMVNGKIDSDYLHGLLLCYLSMNPKDTHKFVINAFTDLVMSLFPGSNSVTVRHRKLKTRQHNSNLQQLLV